MPRRTVAGPFSGRERGAGWWELSGAGLEIHLRVAVPGAVEPLRDSAITSLELQWHAEGVAINVRGSRGSRSLVATTVFIHEPRAQLYQGLPLAGFDPSARRFWRRIFALMQIPGGRFLLGMIARRRSRPAKR